MSMKVSSSWNGDKAEQFVVESSWDRIRRATEFLFQTVKTTLSVPNSGERKKRTRNTVAGKKGSTYTVYPNPSKRGDAPRLRTGHGRGHVQREYDKDALRSAVGLQPGAKYMLFHELGLRPWFLRTVKKVLPQLQEFLRG